MQPQPVPEIPPQADEMGGADDQRDPRAAPFAPDAWPFRDHRSLAELLGPPEDEVTAQ